MSQAEEVIPLAAALKTPLRRRISAGWSSVDDQSLAHRVDYERVDGLHESDLKPRKAGFTIPNTEQEPEFNGLFALGRTGADGRQDKMDLLLLRMGDDVTGGYSNGKIDGFIQGDIGDGVLHFTWRKGNANRHGVAEAQGESLRGTWSLAESE